MKTEITPIYQAKTWKSTVELAEGKAVPEVVWDWIGEGKVILWLHVGICIGDINEGKVTWKAGREWADLAWADHLVELRAFNAEREWRCWQTDGKLWSRKRKDGAAGATVRTIDTQMKLRSVVAEPLAMPGNPTLALQSRHYFDVNARGVSGYVDVRFVDIIPQPQKKKES